MRKLHKLYVKVQKLFLALSLTKKWQKMYRKLNIDVEESERTTSKSCAIEFFLLAAGVRPAILLDNTDFKKGSGWALNNIEVLADDIFKLLPRGFEKTPTEYGIFFYDPIYFSENDFEDLIEDPDYDGMAKVGRILGYACADEYAESGGPPFIAADIWFEDEDGDEVQVIAQSCVTVLDKIQGFFELAWKIELAIKKHQLPITRIEVRFGRNL